MYKLNKKVIVAMSGGVDSSVTAWILKKKGYHVEGLFMKNWEEHNSDSDMHCSSKKDLSDAQGVCNQLNIFLHKVNFSFEYWENVFQKFLFEYKMGRTPNPDVLCNKEIKFKIFFEYSIQDLQAHYIATGHYVQKRIFKNKYFLLRGLDATKDQSYFLYTINQKVLKQCLFPIGHLTKCEVRKIARRINLIVAKKKDSTGICFISPQNIKKFLNHYLPHKSGNIITTLGQKIGQHYGLIHYTIGQRRGLGIGGIKGFNNIPWYVVSKDITNNSLIVSQGMNNFYLMSIGLIANELHWINDINIQNSFFCTAKIRYRHIDIPCKIVMHKKKQIKVLFERPESSVAPGQSVVFYLSDLCLGGGIIKKRLPVLK
ncbi:putative tRNA (5-methylaminomethyl-2-thiouridylate)-methyltransferase [Buchnera aphidicola str. Bp (Baizongia pistaciae)]|uniref:tRNA-specific 2-thiouridylase MnmA n=1 Tax=Buchnera aphidicola subsp. Baizongia pistaciae (strain Bp) TaxID=224915 RepID=MNMA_BUCBP|nr:tRNA 2-thiouridine(34) synthase MnmA [Buchnera aphidicola]P59460.1 RecName: Full=tRNA-specific 2-thiouridylase MnmA [Buchnera aphidicola str. Bp (Baizongia pistaciae)]AAO26969.1 putative tRNA (5-methylaminomethyl-2-thiouridylate)-methyltransferase [Buchnera aphidicola str. Bp (Baizongia pistaciae)]